MDNKVQSAYEKMMNEGKIAPISKSKPTQKLDEIEFGPGEAKKLMVMIKDLEKRLAKIEADHKKLMK